MKGLTTIIVYAAFFMLGLFLQGVLGALFGGFWGWCLEHTFLSEYVLAGFYAFGFHVTAAQLPAIGSLLGMVGGLLHATQAGTSDSK